jgi:hypothetical protein
MRIEGVTYQINWKAFRRNTSFFLPCLDAKAAIDTVLKVTKRLRYSVVTKEVIEDGVKGVRVWRV